MMHNLTLTADARIGLTEVEIAMLGRMLNAGDRAGFYMAYHAMTENPEALLTAQISSFSETAGGTALAANGLLLNACGTSPPANSAPYKATSESSQEVAISAPALSPGYPRQSRRKR